jgi:hypothetical protein
MRRRVWAETVPAEVLRSGRVRGLLRRFGLDVVVAVRPGEVEGLPRTIDALTDDGIAVSIWPMLDDVAGRWANARNAGPFAAFAREVACVLRPGAEIVIDLEPAIDEVRAAERVGVAGLRAAWRALRAAAQGAPGAREVFVELARELRACGMVPSAVAVPMVLLDQPVGRRAPAWAPRWEAILGTPIEGVSWARVNVMLYTSMIEGWSRGVLGRAGAEAILAAGCRATGARFGSRGAVSLGAVWVGALGDEVVYRGPAELARDVAIARACGVEDLALFDLGGVVAREPGEAWLAAFVETAPLDAPLVESLVESRRARIAVGALRALGRLPGVIASLRAISRRARGIAV